jgi:hypothetical protein
MVARWKGQAGGVPLFAGVVSMTYHADDEDDIP